MQRPDYQNRVLELIESKPQGTLFINSDFFDIAESASIRQILKRLVDASKIDRILDGIYAITEYSNVLKKNIYPSPIVVALTLARKFKWNIYPSKHTALNIVGFSNQISNSYEFLSDGPYKKYTYFDYEIIFKKTANKKIKIDSEALLNLVIALDALGKEKIGDHEIKIITNYIKKHDIKSNVLEQSRTIAEWIYSIIRNIVKENAKHD